ncbi:ImmA/IrrE family metallo-endopeptidase [Mastigocladopsis repens]|uniref:ImmA/IrrE family metallo-endopeptidase n=1 Tax=Mastigocladopsis repens TaxID=221287 RepID=UPI0002F06DAA|nr:ImmA/IrrE family metallo-endopeptidase [Mastigocladopsis repens]
MNYAELGRRIRLAREEASLSQDAVAQHLELPRSAVSLIESGKRKVDSLELERFSRLVGKSILFFFDEGSGTVEASNFEEDDPTQILFSANQAVDISKDRDQIERFRQFYRNFSELARSLNRIPDPYSTEPQYNIFKPTPAAARWMAAKERARLGLPDSSPIRDMWDILESQGVRVMAWHLKTPKLGGCFMFSPSLGSFVLVKGNIAKNSANKLNFVLAHEYCHHLIHRQNKGITCDPSGNYRQPEEYFAQWFAANFLMPEEALVPRLITYLEKSDGVITPEIVMHLALDFGVSYEAMLNRMASKGVELIDKSTREEFSQEIVANLLATIGRLTPRFEDLKQFPDEYVEMVFDAYRKGLISLGKLAELLECSLEEAKSQLMARDIPIDLGVDSDSELLSDIENA